MIKHLDNDVFVELQVYFHIFEKSINDHDVQVIFECPIKDYLTIIFVDVVDNERD